jgi:riboflavin kinase/FMN adenylyltransferase
VALQRVQDWRGLAPALRGASVALGSFDGVHCGHREVIRLAADAARERRAPLGVVSFEPHPRRWFAPQSEPFRLTTPAQQARALEQLGVEIFYLLRFDAHMAALSDLAFVEQVLLGGLEVRHVAAGFDVTFGHNKSGGPEQLKAYGERFGFGVSIAGPVTDRSGKCSSTAIRQALREGHPERAAGMLGRPFAIEGEVVHGDHLGRTLGFPTANVALGDYLRPAFGIYASRTRMPDGRELAGVAYVGRRPTVDGVDERLEVHQLDFDEDIYGQVLETDLVAFLRGDQKFDSLDALKAQIGDDCAAARRRLRD